MKSLIHNGIYIPRYSSIGLTIKYKKRKLELSTLGEQMAIAYVRKSDTPYLKDKVFVQNFIADFSKELLTTSEGFKELIQGEIKAEDFDFSEVKQHLEAIRVKTEEMSKEDKKIATQLKKELRDKLKDKYGYATVDGQKIAIQNYLSEPASIFLSKGSNKLRGKWKRGIKENEIVLNLSPEARIPSCKVILSNLSIFKYLKETDPLWGKGLCLTKILAKEENISKIGVLENAKNLGKILELMNAILNSKESTTGKARKGFEQTKNDLRNICRRKESVKENIGKKTKRECGKNGIDGMQLSNSIQFGWQSINKIAPEDQDTHSLERNLNSLLHEVTNARDVDVLISEFWNFIISLVSTKELKEKGLEISLMQKKPEVFKSFVLTAIPLFISLEGSLEFPWQKIVWVPKGLWTASWKSPLDGKMKYVWFSAATKVRQEKEQKKFALASQLGAQMNKLEEFINKQLSVYNIERRKLATVVYLIKTLAIRVGDEKNELGTVGCTTLKAENIKINSNKVHLSFTGKDFVKWERDLEVPEEIEKNLVEFIKRAGDDFLFKGLNSNKVSSFLREVIPGLSAKVFRTYIAGVVWDGNAKENLNLIAPGTSIPLKKYLFKMTNLAVAQKLNHKRALPKNYLERLEEKGRKCREEKEKLLTIGKKTIKRVDDKLESRFQKQQAKVEKLYTDYEIMRLTGEWNLSTSLQSYIDPNKVIEFTKKAGLKIDDVYTKSLKEKYSWAI